jgi:hypothetical protein
MHEAQRLACLNALGIAQYVPLAPIPGALVLPAMALYPEPSAAVEPRAVEHPPVALTEPAAAQPRMPTAAERAAPQQPAVKAAIADVLQRHDPVAESTDIPLLDLGKVRLDDRPAQPPKIKPAASQRFALAVITLPGRLRLLVELAQPDAPGLNAVEHRMVSDLLLAIGSNGEISDNNTRLYRWPLVNNPRIAADASAARDALFAFLASAQDSSAVPATAFLGTAAVSSLHHGEPGALFELADSNGRHLATHSLKALQQDWTLKPVVWGHLQSLLSA